METIMETDNKHLISGSALAIVLRTEKEHNGAEFTVRSKSTGKDYTFKIDRSEFNGKWYTHILVEKQYLNFVRLGTYKDGIITSKHTKINTPAADAMSWILRRVERNELSKLDESIEIMHLGKCLVCGRELTDSDSIAAGIGPICRKR